MRWVVSILVVGTVGLWAVPSFAQDYGQGESAHVESDTHSRELHSSKGDKKDDKAWEVEGIWETHHMIRREDVEGYAANKTVNVGMLYLRYNFSEYDRVWVRGGMYQRFLTDQNETGFRADDIVAAYQRRIPLPEKFNVKLAGQLSAPTSFDSQKEGLITEPRITASIDKKLSRFLFTFKTYGSVHLVKYTTAEGGNPNPSWTWLAMLAAEYQLPFIDMFTIGTSVTNLYTWLYQPGYIQDAPNSSRFGATQDPNYPDSQPVQQAYAWEAYLRYQIPDLAGVKSDLTVSYAQGDPSLGYTSALHDGSRHVYPFFWRKSSTVYAALSVAY